MLECQKSMDVYVVHFENSPQDKVFYFEADAKMYLDEVKRLHPFSNIPEIVKSDMLRYVEVQDEAS